MDSIIITGGTSGIGFECALQMARVATKHQIILPVRNLLAGNDVVEIIKNKTGHKNIKCLELDLASLKSIRHFSESFSKEKHNSVAILINNAGIQNIGGTIYTSDGFELTFGVNHLGPFALTQLLLPFVNNDGHILFTASDTHDPELNLPIAPPIYTSAEELAYPKESSEKQNIVGQRRYSTSKLCNILTAYELQNQVKGTDIRVNAYDPGMTPGTGLAKTYSPFMRFLWKNVLPVLTLFKRNVNTPKQAGKNLATLAFDEKFSKLKHSYFSDGKVIKSSIDSYNVYFQRELWNSSLKLTNIDIDKKHIAYNDNKQNTDDN